MFEWFIIWYFEFQCQHFIWTMVEVLLDYFHHNILILTLKLKIHSKHICHLIIFCCGKNWTFWVGFSIKNLSKILEFFRTSYIKVKYVISNHITYICIIVEFIKSGFLLLNEIYLILCRLSNTNRNGSFWTSHFWRFSFSCFITL